MNPIEINKLKKWFIAHRRDLPWRDNPAPYAVWVSEVMLQQTQVAVVIRYFERWMKLFPTIRDLASAPVDKVIKEWEGLGYYSRARNLHEGAKYVLEHHNGQLPASEADLKKIKGLGPYTIGAILSFAFHQRRAAVDGNVLRVLARYYCLSDDISQSRSVKKIHHLAQTLLPENEPWLVSEALIELGATICGRKPKCLDCPLKNSCRAFAQGMTDTLPFKSVKTKTTPLYRTVAVVMHQDRFLVRRGLKGEIMSDLHEFPYFDLKQAQADVKDLQFRLQTDLKLDVELKRSLSQVKHSFTRYRAQLFPHLFFAKDVVNVPGYEWVTFEGLKSLAFSSGHRRIYLEILRTLPQ